MVAGESVVRLFPTAPRPAEERVPLADRIPPGRLVELSGDGGSAARTTTAVSLVIRGQAEGEPVAWVQPEGGTLYPPDLAASGIDLDALVVVHVPGRAGPTGLARAAELLLRSGGFGLVVVDMTERTPPGAAWQGRLASVARQHESRVVVLTASDEATPSVGAMVALRVAPERSRRAPGRYVVQHRLLRDKLGGADAAPDRRRSPAGLP